MPTRKRDNKMRANFYAIYDAKAAAYMQPFTSTNHATAIRMWEAAVKQEGSQFNQHAEDFSMWHIGSFNEDDGTIEPVIPVSIARALDFVQVELREVKDNG